MGKQTQYQLKPSEDGSLIISVGEARKLLSIDGNGMDDNELAANISQLQELAVEVIKIKPIEKL